MAMWDNVAGGSADAAVGRPPKAGGLGSNPSEGTAFYLVILCHDTPRSRLREWFQGMIGPSEVINVTEDAASQGRPAWSTWSSGVSPAPANSR